MSRIQSPAFRRFSLLLAACLVVLATACGGGETTRLPTGNPGPSPEIVFTVPQDGSTMNAPALVAVTGDGINSVSFNLDGNTIFQDTAAPFEWTLNPGSYSTGSHVLEVVAQTDAGEESVSVQLTLTETPTQPDPPSDVFEAIANLAAGHWYEIPNTRMDTVKPDPKPEGNFGNVTAAWNGGAYDTKRKRLIVWGGGHADYAGNEIYAFDMNTLKWSRLTDPSAFPADDPQNDARSSVHPDGRPVSRHTYDALQYIPDPVDRFFTGGAGSLYRYGNWDNITWFFDFNTNEWTQKSYCPEAGTHSASAVDANGIVWQHEFGLASYDPVKDVWTRHTQNDGFTRLDVIGEVDRANNRFYLIGAGDTVSYDLDATPIVGKKVATTGDKEIEQGHEVGLAYHPGSERIVAWNGGSDVYTLDVNTLVWKRIATSGSVTPGPAVTAGTFGRFRYMPSFDLFIIYNYVDSNVFVYRLPPK